MKEKILVVDDEAAIADLVEVYLTNEGYAVFACGTAAEALEIVAREELSLAILDVMLPDMDGFALCQRIRENHLFPILMLTARGEDTDKITGLTLGADDYVTKPSVPWSWSPGQDAASALPALQRRRGARPRRTTRSTSAA